MWKELPLQTPRAGKKEGGGGAQDTGLESLPLWLVMKTTVRQVVPLQPMEVHSGAVIHLQPREGTPCRSRWRTHAGAACSWRTASHRKDHAGAVHEDLQPMARTHIGEVCGELSPVRGTSHWSRGRMWEVLPLRRKDGQRQRVMNSLQSPFPVPLRCLGWGQEIEKQDWSWASEEGRGGGKVF